MRRRWWIAAAAVLAVPVAALATAAVLLDGDALRARVEAAVSARTGRAFTLSGPVELKWWSLAPTVVLPGPRLTNLPGGSRPEMVSARRVEAGIALLPLLSRRVEIRGVTVQGLDLLLETDAAGQPNWNFAPPPRGPAPAPAAPTPPREPFALDIRAVTVTDSQVTWRDGRSGRAESLGVSRLALSATAEGAPLRAEGALALRGVSLALQAEGGPLSGLLAPGPGTPWPLRATLAAEGLQAELSGTLAGAAWQGRGRVTADRADRLAPFLPGVALPAAEALSLDAALSPAGPAELRLAVGRLDGGALRPGLLLGPLEVAAANLDAPVSARGEAQLNGAPLSWTAELPPVAALRAPGTAPWPLRASLSAEGLAIGLDGTLAGPRIEGAALAVTLRVADLGVVGARFGQPLPGLRDLDVRARLAGLPGGGLAAEELVFTAAQAEGRGTGRFTPGAPATLEAGLDLARLDLDAIPPPRAAAAPATAPAATAPAPAPAPAPDTPPAATAAPPPPAAAPRPAVRRVIPDLPVDLAALRRVNGAVQLRLGTLRAQGLDWRDGAATLLLRDGQLKLDPAVVAGPGGRLFLAATADATAEPPALWLRVQAEPGGLELAPLLAALGAPGGVSGRLELEAELGGRGTGTRALAATATGFLAAAAVDGRLDNRVLAAVAGGVRQFLPSGAGNGSTPLRCLALRFQLNAGVAGAQALLLQTSLADVVGAGTVDLRDERLDLRLLPRLRAGQLGISLPVLLGGTLAAPRTRTDGAAASATNLLNGLAEGDPGEAVAALGGVVAGGEPDCEAQLRVARGGREGPLPAAAPATRAPVGDLLRGLFGR
ncbi:AsmA family protein [Roseomonas sp. BN140053]|uniref:AsmA family protein n=1 Tax=Roseomonas sp. BN140053 TaxID=3391898 RepID=UPI0039EC350D